MRKRGVKAQECKKSETPKPSSSGPKRKQYTGTGQLFEKPCTCCAESSQMCKLLNFNNPPGACIGCKEQRQKCTYTGKRGVKSEGGGYETMAEDTQGEETQAEDDPMKIAEADEMQDNHSPSPVTQERAISIHMCMLGATTLDSDDPHSRSVTMKRQWAITNTQGLANEVLRSLAKLSKKMEHVAILQVPASFPSPVEELLEDIGSINNCLDRLDALDKINNHLDNMEVWMKKVDETLEVGFIGILDVIEDLRKEVKSGAVHSAGPSNAPAPLCFPSPQPAGPSTAPS